MDEMDELVRKIITVCRMDSDDERVIRIITE